MRKYILLAFMYFSACAVAFAQDVYFYDGSTKRHLNVKAGPARSAVEAYVDNDGTYMEATGHIYVKLKSPDDKPLLERVAGKYGMEVAQQNKYLPLWFVLKSSGVKNSSVLKTANEMYETGLFAVCRPDFAINALEISYDPDVLRQWGLYNTGRMEDYGDSIDYAEGVDINVSKAWNYATGRGVVIAIVDEGIDLRHKDLAPNLLSESYDARTDSSPSGIYYNQSTYGEHGTHCAGIAAAVRNNGFLVSGVAPEAKLMSISDEFTMKIDQEFTHANGIMWAWKHGADVISCSWKCMGEKHIVADALDSAMVYGRNGKGCVIVKSAGNDDWWITDPGNLPGVIAVGDIAPDGHIAASSNHGENMLLCAPGEHILSTKSGNRVDYMSGTSMAAPHVSGVVALMLERNPDLTMWQVREILARSARKLDTMTFSREKEYGLWSEYYGYGLLNALGAVVMAIDYK